MRAQLALALSLLAAFCRHSDAIAVMSVDLGSEWLKVGYVSPGIPMEIALNKESKRKSPAVLSFRDNIRTFGEDAQTIGLRFPKSTYSYLLDLLGKPYNHPLVQLYQQRFPYYDIVEDTERGTVLFKHDEETFFSPEELVSQILTKAREFAENGAGQPIKECVLTVPGFFNQVERKALLQAASLANLKVLQLINDYTAVALNYGIFRSKDFNETAQYIMFYDMGASSTTATLVSYQTVKTKERGFVETHPQVAVVGVGFDRTLGGIDIQLKLRDHLAKKFTEVKKTKSDVYKNARAMAKLFKEAGRVKNVLSANAEHYAQIEGLLDEEDFKVLVKREQLEALLGDWFDRVKRPVEQALKTAHLTIDVLSQVVLVGAGTRVPRVQEILQKVVGQELAKNLNTDEAAAMGAVYKAADLSTGFQVKKFITKDAVLYPIQVVFERDTEDGTKKQVKRMLFSAMNPFPQKKIITFNKHTHDFSFNVHYADLEYLGDDTVRQLGNVNLSLVNLEGVADVLQKNTGDNVETKGIKAHFAMDDSGILNLVNVELVVEKTVTDADDEGALSKLGSTISKLFGGDDEKEQKVDDAKPEEAVKNETVTNSTASNTTEEVAPKPPKPRVITLKEPIKSTEEPQTIAALTPAQVTASLEKLAKLDKVEFEINRRSSALNNLESFVIDVQTRLDEKDFAAASSKDEAKKIREACSEAAEWLYEDGSDADADTYEKKLEDLKILTKGLFSRVWEHNERPEALKALDSMLNHSTQFLTTAANLTKDTSPEKDVFTQIEIDSLSKIISDTKEWKAKQMQEQALLKKYEVVKLTVRSITDKMAALDREVKYLVGKLKLWRPKKVEKPVREVDPEGKEEAKTSEKSEGEKTLPDGSGDGHTEL